MTAILSAQATLIPAAMPAPVGVGDAAPGASFADNLLTLLGRALAEPAGAGFAAGTMRSSVEMFDEHGFFEDRTATSGQGADKDAAGASDPDLASASGAGSPGAVAAPSLQPYLASDPSVAGVAAPPVRIAPVALPATMLASNLAADDPAATVALPPATPPLANGAAAIGMSPPPRAVPLASVAASGDLVPDAASRPSPVRRDLPAPGNIALRVSLDHGEAGVAVSVVGDVGADTDTAPIHEAVSHLLARHGLVLSELRVTRRPGGEGQERKD